MPVNRSIRKAIAITIATVLAVGATASAATVGAPQVIMPGAKLPVNFPGYKEPANNKIPANHRVLRYDVEVTRGERATTVLVAPKGFVVRSFAADEAGEVFAAKAGSKKVVGKRSVRVTLSVNTDKVDAGETGRGAFYLLARRA